MFLLCRAYGKGTGSGYAPPKARRQPAGEGRASYASADDDEDREDLPLVSGASSGLDSFFSHMENTTRSSVRSVVTLSPILDKSNDGL